MKLPANYLDIEQGSLDWFNVRCGAVTASRIRDVLAKTKAGTESASRSGYKLELLAEMLTGKTAEHYVSVPMAYGVENEPLARAAYELSRDVEVERIGYVRHPKIKQAGASPDGILGEQGMVEIKVPNTTTHLGYLIGERVPAEYVPQMTWQLACSGRQWNDFVSYDPRLPESCNLFVCRLERDEQAIYEMEQEVAKFLVELNVLAARFNLPLEAGPGPERAEIPA